MRQQQLRRHRTRRGEAAVGVEEPPPARTPRAATAGASRVLENIDAALADA